jgi:acyl-coenzyme A thioesterase PaaI-like protein
MADIANPFEGTEGYNCFGCSPSNPIGLRLRFRDEGEAVSATWEPRPEFAGFHGVLHGGIQATLHDEIASWYVFVKLGTAGFTSDLTLRYLSPVYISKGALRLVTTLSSNDGRRAVMRTTLYDGGGTVCSESDVSYAIVPEHIARRKFRYPGKEAFIAAGD